MNFDELTLHIAMRYQESQGCIRDAIELVQGDVQGWNECDIHLDNEDVFRAWIRVLSMADKLVLVGTNINYPCGTE